jgi:hypothetical protein
VTQVAQQRDKAWVTVRVTVDREAEAIELLQTINVDASGIIDLSSSNGYKIVDQTSQEFSPTVLDATSLELHRQGMEQYVLVETADGDPAILFRQARITLTTINGREGWISTTEEIDGVYNSLAWRETPNHMVIVSAHNISVAEGCGRGDVEAGEPRIHRAT